MKPGLFVCQCGVRKRIPEKHIGRTVECPECKTPSMVVRNPRLEADEAGVASPPPTMLDSAAAERPTAPVMEPSTAPPSMEPPTAPPTAEPPVMQDEVVLELANETAAPATDQLPKMPVVAGAISASLAPPPVLDTPAPAPAPAGPMPTPAPIPPGSQTPAFEAPTVTAPDADFGAADTSSTQFVRRHGKLLSTVGFVFAALIMVLAIIAVIVAFVTFTDKGAVVMPAIGILLGAAVMAFGIYYWLRLIGAVFVVFADIERNTRKR